MRLSSKQKQILEVVREHGQVNLTHLVDEFGHWYYYNEKKHLGALLSNMVKVGLLERIKPGLFKVGPGRKHAVNHALDGDQDQTKLF